MNIVSRRWETCLAPHRQVLDEEKLKFFSSKISIWDHFSMDGASHKSLSTEEKTALVKRYYVESECKYYCKERSNFCSLLSPDIYFWLVSVIIFYMLILVIIVPKIFLLLA